VSYAGSAIRGEILGVERQRFWRDEDKLEIVASGGIAGVVLAQITRQQIDAGRHDLKKKGLWSLDARALFFPFDMPVAAGVPVVQIPVAEQLPLVTVELRMRRGCNLNS
jgi:transposase